jgi:hypothetical protein
VQGEEDKEAFNNICTIIQRKHQRNFWQRLNFITGKKKTRSATNIQVKSPGEAIMEQKTQDAVEHPIFSKVHDKQYSWGSTNLQQNALSGLQISGKYASIDNCSCRNVRTSNRLGPSHRQNIRRNCHNPRYHPEGFSIHQHHAQSMETVLESGEQRDILVGVGPPLWSL